MFGITVQDENNSRFLSLSLVVVIDYVFPDSVSVNNLIASPPYQSAIFVDVRNEWCSSDTSN